MRSHAHLPAHSDGCTASISEVSLGASLQNVNLSFECRLKRNFCKNYFKVKEQKRGLVLYFQHSILQLRGESAVMSYEAAEGSGGKRDGVRIPGSSPELSLFFFSSR